MAGRVRIAVKGLNQERAFNALSKEVNILKLDRKDKHICEIEVSPSDLKKTQKFLQEQNFEVKILKFSGFRAFFRRFLSCYGVFAGVVLTLCAYLVQRGFVWQIKVLGINELSSAQVERCVEKALPSRWIGSIKTRDIEIELKENFDKISSVSVAIVGQSLIVNISEALLPEEMGNFEPILSGYDCRITDVTLIQGTLAVAPGDIVRVGQTLVEPFIIDSDGEKRAVRPMAKFKAEVWLVGSAQHSDRTYVTNRTGRKIEVSEISLFGLKIYSNGKKNTFSQFESEKTVENLNKNLILPFKITKTKFYETKTELKEVEFAEVKQQIIDSARQKALQKNQDYAIIKEDYSLAEADGVHIVTYIVTVSIEIGGT